MQGLKLGLADNIWKTRKSRINASERLKRNDLVSQIFLAYYSFWIIVITIVDIKSEELNFELLTLVLAIAILVISIFTFAMNYKERSLKFQSAYIKLHKLYRQALNNEKNNIDNSEIEKEYDNILELTENHSECDYLQVRYSVRNDENYKEVNQKFECSDYFAYFMCFSKTPLMVTVLLSAPILFCYFFI
jgi:ABC-type multidrug transport system fused ATPase/permease subunit